jgi:hypothetical protein
MANDPEGENDPVLFEFGSLRILIQFGGWLGNQPAFFMAAEAPGGHVAEARLASTSPLYTDSVIWFVKDLRRVLRMGVLPYVKLRMMKEGRKSVQEREEGVREATAMFEVATIVTDAVLEGAERELAGLREKEDKQFQEALKEKLSEQEGQEQESKRQSEKRKGSSMKGVAV